MERARTAPSRGLRGMEPRSRPRGPSQRRAPDPGRRVRTEQAGVHLRIRWRAGLWTQFLWQRAVPARNPDGQHRPVLGADWRFTACDCRKEHAGRCVDVRSRVQGDQSRQHTDVDAFLFRFRPGAGGTSLPTFLRVLDDLGSLQPGRLHRRSRDAHLDISEGRTVVRGRWRIPRLRRDQRRTGLRRDQGRRMASVRRRSLGQRALVRGRRIQGRDRFRRLALRWRPDRRTPDRR
jgi:hypothetical protein